MVDSTDHVTGKTALSPTVTISKNGGAFASPFGAVTELSSGWYAIAGNATDRNTIGELLIHATGTGADPLDERYLIVPFDPFDAAALGLSLLDVAVSTRLASASYTAPPTASENADANWDEVLSGHLTAGTAGKALSDASAAGTPLDAAGVRAALGMATPNMDAQFNALPTATENADALLDRSNAIDAGLTPRHALELAAASVLQKLTGAGTGTERVRNFSDTADLATVTVDGSGNKNAIIYDFSI